MKNKKAIVLMWLLSLLPFLLVALFWGRMPELVPIHWNAAGQADSYASKSFLWWLCVIAPVMALLLQFLPRLDPKKENYKKFQNLYDLVAITLPCIMLFVMGVTIAEAINPGGLKVGRLIMGFLSLLFMFLGNLMGKIKTNWFMGIRTPWALSDPDVWNKTQRMGGRVFFLAGLAALLTFLWAPVPLMAGAFGGILAVGIIVTYFMSWKWFRDKAGQNKKD